MNHLFVLNSVFIKLSVAEDMQAYQFLTQLDNFTTS